MTASKPRQRRRRARSSADVIKVAILRLPTRLRDVFVLHRFGGMTYDEIGLHLGIPPEAVKAAFAAAMVRLARAVRTSERDEALELTRPKKREPAAGRSAPKRGGL
ncbi:RNA polymerase sigma factor [Brevundimonas nasdae]|uniref:RNA polymerase sigma factor n=1 Tax=Brevundimonas nasdae TaxID=172043 RepID=UPI003F691F0F